MGEVATEKRRRCVRGFLNFCVALRCVAWRRGVPRRDVLALTHVVIRARSEEDSSCFPAGKLSNCVRKAGYHVAWTVWPARQLGDRDPAMQAG